MKYDPPADPYGNERSCSICDKPLTYNYLIRGWECTRDHDAPARTPKSSNKVQRRKRAMSTTDPLVFFGSMTAKEQIEFGRMYDAGDIPAELADAWRVYCASERERIQRKNDAAFARMKKLITQPAA